MDKFLLLGYWAAPTGNIRHGYADIQPLIQSQIAKISKFCVTPACAGNSPVTGEFPAQRTGNSEMFPYDDVIMEVMAVTEKKRNAENLPIFKAIVQMLCWLLTRFCRD